MLTFKLSHFLARPLVKKRPHHSSKRKRRRVGGWVGGTICKGNLCPIIFPNSVFFHIRLSFQSKSYNLNPHTSRILRSLGSDEVVILGCP